MDPCLKEDICRTERWIRRPGTRTASGSPGTLNAAFMLLVGYESARSTQHSGQGSGASPADLIISEEKLCKHDRVYVTEAMAIADRPAHVIQAVKNFPDLSCGAALNAIDHYESTYKVGG